jgi:hypothetical protein
LIEPVCTAQVGCVTAAVGIEGKAGTALIVTVVTVEIQVMSFVRLVLMLYVPGLSPE